MLKFMVYGLLKINNEFRMDKSKKEVLNISVGLVMWLSDTALD